MDSKTPETAPGRGQPSRRGTLLLRVLRWGRSHASGLTWLAACVPYTWRLSLRRQLHATMGTPMAPLPLPASRRSHLATSPRIRPGINLLGYGRGEFGIAESLRSYARALGQSGYPFDIFNLDVGTASRQQDASMERHFSDALRYAINAFFVNADQMPITYSVLGQPAFAGHYNIGYWLWELEKFPRDWRGSFKLVDEVWAPTTFVRDAIGAATGTPVLRMPMPIEFEAPRGMDRTTFGLPPDEFVFLFSYDFNGFASRKNPDATIAAFRRAFDGRVKGVRLLVKSSNGDRFPDRLEALQRSVSDDRRIEIRDGFLTREEMFGLQNASDAFISLHRSEGFGMGLAECMYLGKPVIATGYSGNMDFMDASNSMPVDYRLISLHRGDYPYWQGQQWAEPDIQHAARLMRQVFDEQEFARRLGAKAAASIRRTHSRAACAAAIITRLSEIDRQLSIA